MAKAYVLRPPTGKGPVVSVTITDFGATVTNLVVRDRDGVQRDVVLGYDAPEDYVAAKSKPGYPYFGATVGRIANRIVGAEFELDGKTYELRKDLGQNSLHGGKDSGWDCKIWTVDSQDRSSISFSRTSPDGEGGFPGAVHATARYALTDDGTLSMEYGAKLVEGASTIVNMTNHAYFNLSGLEDPSVDGTVLHFSEGVKAWLRRDPKLDWAPSGEVVPIGVEPAYDFRSAAPIGSRNEGNFDDFFVADPSLEVPCATATCPSTGIRMEMRTDAPGFQLYVPSELEPSYRAKKTQGGGAYGPRAAFCLETSKYPAAINYPDWRNQVILKAGQTYSQKTLYTFYVVGK
ncbi:aldose 1-epimerase [Hyaloraphidium curvatum]|nr:aldose 1-epimerase [Hyaloraphidium curvatum]